MYIRMALVHGNDIRLDTPVQESPAVGTRIHMYEGLHSAVAVVRVVMETMKL